MIPNTIAAACAVIVMAGPAAASDKSDVMAAVRHYVAAFNKGDTQAANAACTTPAAIIDEFPPHIWQGATACPDWQARRSREGCAGGAAASGQGSRDFESMDPARDRHWPERSASAGRGAEWGRSGCSDGECGLGAGSNRDFGAGFGARHFQVHRCRRAECASPGGKHGLGKHGADG